MRTQSVLIAYSILDSIRANPGVDYAIAMEATPPSSAGCEGAVNCSVTDLRNYDQAVWKCSLGNFNDRAVCQNLGVQGILPEGDGSIERDGNVYTITVQWLDDLEEDAEPKQFTMSAQI